MQFPKPKYGLEQAVYCSLPEGDKFKTVKCIIIAVNVYIHYKGHSVVSYDVAHKGENGQWLMWSGLHEFRLFLTEEECNYYTIIVKSHDKKTN